MDARQLVDAALAVRAHAHAPYSNYRVGAAILDEKGRVHVGCNVENAAYPEGICAEANAIGSMVAAGGRAIVRIAVVGGRDQPGACVPCGGCRQRIGEFSNDNTRVTLLSADGELTSHPVEDLLPAPFRLDPHGTSA